MREFLRADHLAFGELLAWWERCRRAVGEVGEAEFVTVAGGNGHTVTGDYGTASGGCNNQVLGNYAVVAGGYGAVARLHGQQAHAAGYLNTPGDAQHSVVHLFRSITDPGAAGFHRLYLDGAGKECEMPDDTAWAIQGTLVGKVFGAARVGGYRLYATLRRSTGTASVVLIYALTTNMGLDAGFPTASPRIVADTTLGGFGLDVYARGVAGEVIHWSARLELAEVMA